MHNISKLQELLNYNFLKYTNKTISCGRMDLPALYCNTKEEPDFLALYSETYLYHKTLKTAVCFYQYDSSFDGKNGLFWAIYFNNRKLLEFFKKRFQGVKFVITPDYSEYGDIHRMENEYRLFRARIVGIWFMIEIGAVVIPSISFPTERSFDFALDGLDRCSVVAMSTKSHMNSEEGRNFLMKKIRHTVDMLNLRAVIVYDVCSTDEKTLQCFSYALEKDIRVVIPSNTLKDRNKQQISEEVIDG